ncbi:MAG: acetylxylan esterase, partial [Planctomycetota bacterium]
MSHLSILVGLLTLTALAATAAAEPEGFNYDESKVPNYKLPDPLTMASGAIVSDANDWVARRRPEILELFEKHVFGRSPAPRDDQSFEVTWVDQAA